MPSSPVDDPRYDVIVVGAGVGGLYAVHRLRERGLRVLCLEAGGGVGGVWYHNAYPGARVDVESIDYCYWFSPELYRDWRWTERYAAQPELRRYLEHVADRFALRPHLRLNTAVTGARWTGDRYEITAGTGERFGARFLVMATGNLSAAREPAFPGLGEYAGEWVQTSHWPEGGIDVAGRRIAVIGTGSSGVQTVTEIAKTAEHVVVFQRTPNYSVPAHNGPLDEKRWSEIAADVPKVRRELLETRGGQHIPRGELPTTALDAAGRRAQLERAWESGGHAFNAVFPDQGVDAAANAVVADFVKDRIRERVGNPALAEKLVPYDHPIGTRRLCVDTGYYEVYGQDNVTLVDARDEPIESLTRTGVRTRTGHHDVDLVVFALGFHAFRGAIDGAGIRNGAGAAPTDAWDRGPRTVLGLMTHGFPNLFTLTGAGSPSVLANMTLMNEVHVDWVADCIGYLDAHGHRTIEPTREAEDEWGGVVAAAADRLLRRQVRNYMAHVNEDGSRVFMPYIGGLDTYIEQATAIAEAGYRGFMLDGRR
ncbi:NAD(P)/FAD-dependent oxidoreductase [Pseudonocardia sp. NPDC049154]|uniref:flavin-containing monooxygenase n=1 Tax=Pseudonocardia sp. NPDC049154 TaxID=3155501 RepID=UPI0033E0A80F